MPQMSIVLLKITIIGDFSIKPKNKVDRDVNYNLDVKSFDVEQFKSFLPCHIKTVMTFVELLKSRLNVISGEIKVYEFK